MRMALITDQHSGAAAPRQSGSGFSALSDDRVQGAALCP